MCDSHVIVIVSVVQCSRLMLITILHLRIVLVNTLVNNLRNI